MLRLTCLVVRRWVGWDRLALVNLPSQRGNEILLYTKFQYRRTVIFAECLFGICEPGRDLRIWWLAKPSVPLAQWKRRPRTLSALASCVLLPEAKLWDLVLSDILRFSGIMSDLDGFGLMSKCLNLTMDHLARLITALLP